MIKKIRKFFPEFLKNNTPRHAYEIYAHQRKIKRLFEVYVIILGITMVLGVFLCWIGAIAWIFTKRKYEISQKRVWKLASDGDKKVRAKIPIEGFNELLKFKLSDTTYQRAYNIRKKMNYGLMGILTIPVIGYMVVLMLFASIVPGMIILWIMNQPGDIESKFFVKLPFRIWYKGM